MQKSIIFIEIKLQLGMVVGESNPDLGRVFVKTLACEAVLQGLLWLFSKLN